MSGQSRAFAPWVIVFAVVLGLAARGQEAPRAPKRDGRQTPVAQASSRVAPSVVRVELVSGEPLKDAPRRRLFRALASRRRASGIVVGRDLIVTHAALGLFEAPAYQVTTASGRRYDARLLRLDRAREIAVLQTSAPLDAPTAVTRPSSAVSRGSLVIALGDPFGMARDAQATVTLGVLEGRVELDAAEASYRGEVLLTDAAINPGSEGGPLVDLDGRVIGVLAPLAQDRRLDTNGLGTPASLTSYAIPIEEALQVVRPRQPAAPPLGFRGRVRDQGLEVVIVEPGGAAERAGLRPGDVIQRAGTLRVETGNDLRRAAAHVTQGAGLELEVSNGGRVRRVVLRFGDSE